MSKISTIFLIFMSVFFKNADAQSRGQARIDSLLTALKNYNAHRQEIGNVNDMGDTIKSNLLNDLGFTYYAIDPEAGLGYSKEGLALAEKLHWKTGKSRAYKSIAICYATISENDSALIYFMKALKIDEEMQNKPKVAATLSNIGNLYIHSSDYPKALEYFLKSLKMHESLEDSSGIAIVFGNIAQVYDFESDYPKALEYYNKSIEMNEALGDIEQELNSLSNIAGVYNSIHNYDMAMACYKRALKISDELGNIQAAAKINSGMAIVYAEGKSDYTNALKYFLIALKLFEELGDKSAMANCTVNIGNLYADIAVATKHKDTQMALYRKSKLYLQKALPALRELGSLKNLSEAYLDLSDVLTNLGESKEAFLSYVKYSGLRDSVFNMEKEKKLTETALQYEFDKRTLADSLQKEAQLKTLRLKQQLEIGKMVKERNLYIFFAGIVILILVFFFQRRINQNKLKEKEKEADYQKELMLATVNSEEKERKRISQDLYIEVGSRLSEIKTNLEVVDTKLKSNGLQENFTTPARDLLDLTITNVGQISKDLLPPTLEEFGLAQALHELTEKTERASGIKIIKDIEPINPGLKPEQELALYRVIQEMMNNAIKHAEATQFNIIMLKNRDSLNLTFADNGKGFDMEAVRGSKSGRQGSGLKNLENRINVAGGSMAYSTAPGKGSRIEIVLSLNV